MRASPILIHRTTQVVGGWGWLLKGFTNMVNLTPGLSKIKPIRGVRPFSTSPFVSNPYSPACNNKFLMDMDRKCKDKYQNLPAVGGCTTFLSNRWRRSSSPFFFKKIKERRTFKCPSYTFNRYGCIL
uniref:Uncharacterized protein n=1 Tax=Morchella importuna TaxID=1174673 RepID=A0A650AFI4_9PEZI|nr:hypothetical protein [Morchella importuna]QGN66661.1 hypothetical protein [Morchella importuna]